MGEARVPERTIHLAGVVLAILHALAGGLWLGGVFYSLFVLRPRAQRYFAREAQFEEFVAAVSHGGRAKFLLALAGIAVTGAGLAYLRWRADSPGWLTVLCVKTALFLTIAGAFAYISWRLWPARVFAAGAELRGVQGRFRQIGVAIFAAGVLSLALGVVMHAW